MDPLGRLADYEDSDEEEAPLERNPRLAALSKRRRSTNSNYREHPIETEEMEATDEASASHLGERRSTELPEAPVDEDDDDVSSHGGGGRSDFSISEDEHDVVGERKKDEPVAPRGGGAAAALQRGQGTGVHSPSPLPGGSALGTPTALGGAVIAGRPSGLPFVPSGLSLVGYDGGEAEEPAEDVENNPPPPPPGGAMLNDDSSYQGMPSPVRIDGKATADDLDDALTMRPIGDAVKTEEDETERVLHEAIAELADVAHGSAGGSTPMTECSEDGDEKVFAPFDDPSQPPVVLPLEPEAKCDPLLVEKFQKYFAQKNGGYNFNDMIQRRKDFRNPSMYEKLIKMFDVDEFGSNFPKTVFDPHGFKPTDYYDKIAEQQKTLMDKVNKGGSSSAAVVGKPADQHSTTSNEGLSAATKARRSKWDAPVGTTADAKK